MLMTVMVMMNLNIYVDCLFDMGENESVFLEIF